MRLMGIDYGTKRIGIALSDEDQKLAFPYVVFPYDKKTVMKIQELAEKEGVEAIVIGESRNFQQEENPIMSKVRIFIDRFKEVSSLPIYFEPEYLTTAEAKRHGKPGMMDASAAAIILQSYIDRHTLQTS